MRSGSALAALCLAVLAAAACAGEEAAPDGTAADSSAGLAADRPLLAPGSVRLEERLRLSDPRLETPSDVAVDGEGSIYVLDAVAPSLIHKYDATGAYQLQFGTRDTVRERIGAAVEMDLAQWGILLLADRGENAVKSFLMRGMFASVVPRRDSVVLDVHALPDFGEFYLHEWVPTQRRVSILHMRAPGDSLATAYSVGIPQGLSVRQEARAIHFHSAADRRGRLYVAFLDGYPVRVLSRQGATLATIGIRREPLPRTAEEIERETEANLERLRSQAPDVAEEILLEAARPDSTRPLIEELAVDPQDRLWVRTHRPDAAGRTPYDLFNGSGEYLARVDVPGRVIRTAFSPMGELWVVVETDGGVEVVGYRVVVR